MTQPPEWWVWDEENMMFLDPKTGCLPLQNHIFGPVNIGPGYTTGPVISFTYSKPSSTNSMPSSADFATLYMNESF